MDYTKEQRAVALTRQLIDNEKLLELIDGLDVTHGEKGASMSISLNENFDKLMDVLESRDPDLIMANYGHLLEG